MTFAVESVVWWAAAVGVWLVSLSAYSSHDLLVAIACGLPCGLTAAAARRALRARWRPPGATIRWLAVLPASVAVDAGRVLSLPWRPTARKAAGGFRRVDLGATGGAARATGARALASVLLSSTPGSYVVDTNADDGTALIHALTTGSPIERQVKR